MSIDVTPSSAPLLSDLVAEEIRAMMARRRLSGRELARRLDVSSSWIAYRLGGTQEIGLNDLQRIAAVLGVSAADLMPRGRIHDKQPPAPRVPGQRVVAIAGEVRPARTPAPPRPSRPPRPHRPGRSVPQTRPIGRVDGSRPATAVSA